MENDRFVNLSENQKRQKLKFILKEKTQGLLSDAELSEIISKVKLGRQYGIKLYFETEDFESALILPKTTLVEVVLGTIAFNEKTGIRRLVNKENPSAVIVKYEMYIYIPKNRRPKGKKDKKTGMVLCGQNCVDEKYICQHVEYSESCLFCSFNPPKEGISHA